MKVSSGVLLITVIFPPSLTCCWCYAVLGGRIRFTPHSEISSFLQHASMLVKTPRQVRYVHSLQHFFSFNPSIILRGKAVELKWTSLVIVDTEGH